VFVGPTPTNWLTPRYLQLPTSAITGSSIPPYVLLSKA
jgi:hypothetical protein